MHFFNKDFYWSGDVWKWFGFTILPSLLPMFVSVFLAVITTPLPREFETYLKTNDLIFMGLSITISNLNEWRDGIPGNIEDKVLILSIVLLIVFGVCLGAVYSGHNSSIVMLILVSLITYVAVKLSILITLRKSSLSSHNPKPSTL